jgi:hypothetical protein
MKNCLRPARPAVVRAYDAALYAASAKEKAIACLSTEARPPCNSEARSDGNARAQRKTLGIPTECLADCQRSSLPQLHGHFHSGAVSLVLKLSLVADRSPTVP